MIPESWRQLAVRLAAELAIIVLGVTLALWADGWVSERGDRAREAARLTALHQELERASAALAFNLDNARGAISALRRVIEATPSSGGDRREDLRYAFLFGGGFSAEISVYEDLENAGELSLLTDPRVRTALAYLDNRLQLIELAQADLGTVQQLHIDSYLLEQIDARPLYGGDIGLVDVALDAESADRLLDDRGFRNRMLLKLDLVTQLRVQYEEGLNAVTTAKTLIGDVLQAD